MSIGISLVEFILFDNLRYFRKPNFNVDHDTKFSDAISDDEVAGASPLKMFKNVSRYDIYINGGGQKDWPDKWAGMSCSTLAKMIVTLANAGAAEVDSAKGKGTAPATAKSPAVKGTRMGNTAAPATAGGPAKATAGDKK